MEVNVPINVTRRSTVLDTTGTSASRPASQPPLLGTTFKGLTVPAQEAEVAWYQVNQLPSVLRLEKPGPSSLLPISDAPRRPPYPNDSRKSAPGRGSEATLSSSAERRPRGGRVPPQTAYPAGPNPTVPTSSVISNAFPNPL